MKKIKSIDLVASNEKTLTFSLGRGWSNIEAQMGDNGTLHIGLYDKVDGNSRVTEYFYKGDFLIMYESVFVDTIVDDKRHELQGLRIRV